MALNFFDGGLGVKLGKLGKSGETMAETGRMLRRLRRGAEMGRGRQEAGDWGNRPRGHEKAAMPGLCGMAVGCGGFARSTKPDGGKPKAGQKGDKAEEGKALGQVEPSHAQSSSVSLRPAKCSKAAMLGWPLTPAKEQ